MKRYSVVSVGNFCIHFSKQKQCVPASTPKSMIFSQCRATQQIHQEMG